MKSEKILKDYKKIAKSMLVEGNAWDRKFGDPLPTIQDVIWHNMNEEEQHAHLNGMKEASQDDDDYPDPYEEDNPDPYDPYDPDDPNRYPKPGSYEAKLGRSPMCCKKCKNGKFKHQCDDDQKGGNLKYDSTNCVYETISDCQLNKRTSKKKKKSKK